MAGRRRDGAEPAAIQAMSVGVAGPVTGMVARLTNVPWIVDLRLVAEGLSNRDVAARLSISDKTVERHLVNVFVKLGVPNRSAAAAYAFRAGIV